MNPRLYLLELRMLARERGAWLICALFAAALVYGVVNGASVAERLREGARAVVDDAAERESSLREVLAQRPVEAKSLAGQGAVAVLPPAPAPLLAIGQSDLVPAHETISIWKLSSPASTKAELENPSHLLAGRFDLAFVIVWLYPLFLLALVYDLLAGDREVGTLRLALAQGVRPWRWMARRALARATPIVLLALAATVAAALSGEGGDLLARAALGTSVVLAYGLFWVALAMAVNSVARSAAGAATALGAFWVLVVMVAPTLLNAAVEAIWPTPPRAELVARAREAAADAQKRRGELLNSFYVDHPELAPPGRQADFAAMRLAVEEEVARATEPLRREFAEQLERQQRAVGRWRYASPAIAVDEALTDLAGTGYWRHREFREQTDAFKREIAEFWTPKIHRRERVSIADWNEAPRFEFAEEDTGAWLARVGASVAGVLAFCVVLAIWSLWWLRPSRLGVVGA